jgi:hypothetical protein
MRKFICGFGYLFSKILDNRRRDNRLKKGQSSKGKNTPLTPLKRGIRSGMRKFICGFGYLFLQETR